MKIKFEDITETTILELIENGISESKFLEYKEDIILENSDQKKEFLADVSAFANADGGDIIFGIKELNSETYQIEGLRKFNEVQFILSIENLIRDGITPRIQIECKFLSVKGNNLLIIRVKRSWNKPHWIEFKNYHKFYSRNSAGKYPLDLSELRTIFQNSDQFTEKIRHFKSTRLNEIFINETYITIGDQGKLVVHLIPYEEKFSDLIPLNNISTIYNDINPIRNRGLYDRINFDGLLLYSGKDENFASSYLQVFRNGTLEYVNTSMFTYNSEPGKIPSSIFENEIEITVKKSLNFYKKYKISFPIVIYITFLNIKNYEMAIGNDDYWEKKAPYKKNSLILPELIINSEDDNLDLKLKSNFDLIWNAFGYQHSPNYDEHGKRKNQKQ